MNSPRTSRAAGLLAILLPGTAFAGSRAGRPLLPDLSPSAAALSVYRFETSGTRRLLRFPTVIHNTGAGPLEIAGRPSPSLGPGRMQAKQLLYDRRGRVVSRQRMGQFEYHREHGHWHLLAVARYRLLHPDGRPAAEGRKVSFCLTDSLPQTPPLSGAPASPVYGPCPKEADAPRLRAGISRGWSDLYRSDVDGQWVDVTGLRPGPYVLEVRIDPEHRLRERTRRNNTARARVVLPAPPGFRASGRG